MTEPPSVPPASFVEDTTTITTTGAEKEGDIYDVTFPSQASLGLTLLPTKLCYGEGKSMDICVVSASSLTSLVQEGDMLLGINHKMLCSTNQGHCVSPEEFLQAVVLEGILPIVPPRQLSFVRGSSEAALDSVLFLFQQQEIGLFKTY